MEIYKINQISLNQTNTQFCLSYNKGIKIFRTSDYQLVSSSNTNDTVLGDISCAVLLYESNIVVFTGSKHNDFYHDKKLVVFDNIKHTEVYSTLFKDPIKSIEVCNKYIFVGSDKEINVLNFNTMTNIQFVLTIEIKNSLTKDNAFNFRIWTKIRNSIVTYYIALLGGKGKIDIHSFYDTNFKLDQVFTLKSPYSSLQNIFYVSQYDLIFLVDSYGSNIASYSGESYQKEQDFYRGTTKGVITSIIGLSNNYLAMANLDKTIHIFLIGKNQKATITSLLYNILNTNVISSTLKIRLNEITKDNPNDFYDSYFKQLGTVLVYSQEQKELNCLCYNGYAYLIKLNLHRMTYEIIKNIEWCSNSNMINDISLDNPSLSLQVLESSKKKTEAWKII